MVNSTQGSEKGQFAWVHFSEVFIPDGKIILVDHKKFKERKMFNKNKDAFQKFGLFNLSHVKKSNVYGRVRIGD